MPDSKMPPQMYTLIRAECTIHHLLVLFTKAAISLVLGLQNRNIAQKFSTRMSTGFMPYATHLYLHDVHKRIVMQITLSHMADLNIILYTISDFQFGRACQGLLARISVDAECVHSEYIENEYLYAKLPSCKGEVSTHSYISKLI